MWYELELAAGCERTGRARHRAQVVCAVESIFQARARGEHQDALSLRRALCARLR